MNITADVKLPRGGNEEAGIPSEVIMRGATVSEWKSITSSSSKKYRYAQLWKLCDETPGWKKDIEIQKYLHPIDINQLMYFARILTLGPEVEIKVKCPNCEEETYVMLDLSTIEFTEFDGKNRETYTFTYETSKGEKEEVTMVIKAMTEEDVANIWDKAEKELKERKKAIKNYDLSVIDILSEILPYERVESINGQKVSTQFIKTKYPNISVEDYLEISEIGEELNESVTIKDKTCKCSFCDNEFEYSIPNAREILLYKHSRKSRASEKRDGEHSTDTVRDDV